MRRSIFILALVWLAMPAPPVRAEDSITLRTPSGITLGHIRQVSKDRRNAYSASGILLGYYLLSTDKTYKPNGVTFGQGDLLSALIYEASQR